MNLFNIVRRLSLLLCLALPLGGCNEKDADLFYQSIPYIQSVRIYRGHTSYAEVDVSRLKPLLKRVEHDRKNYFYKGAYLGRVFLEDGTDLDLIIDIFDTSFRVRGIKGSFVLKGEIEERGTPKETRSGDLGLWKELKDEAWENHSTEIDMPRELSEDLNETKKGRVSRNLSF